MPAKTLKPKPKRKRTRASVRKKRLHPPVHPRVKPDQRTTRGLLLEATAKVRDSDLNTIVEKSGKIEGKAKSGGALDRFLGDIKLLLAMVAAFVSRRYREMPVGTIAAVAGTLLYILSPIDFIPDFIPGVGLVDDAAVLRACLNLVGYDIRKFREWKRRHA